jgi:hypothetical protein
VFDGLAHPHSSIPYVKIGFNMHLYIKVLFSRESLDFRSKSRTHGVRMEDDSRPNPAENKMVDGRWSLEAFFTQNATVYPT